MADENNFTTGLDLLRGTSTDIETKKLKPLATTIIKEKKSKEEERQELKENEEKAALVLKYMNEGKCMRCGRADASTFCKICMVLMATGSEQQAGLERLKLTREKAYEIVGW
jgi:hypothetical protein